MAASTTTSSAISHFTFSGITADGLGNIYYISPLAGSNDGGARIRKLTPDGSSDFVLWDAQPWGRADVPSNVVRIRPEVGDLYGTSRVLFNTTEVPITSIAAAGDEVTVTLPDLAPGIYDIKVYKGLVSDTLPRLFERVPGNYTASHVDPPSAPAHGPGWVTLYGTGFPPQMIVYFNGPQTGSVYIRSYRVSPTEVRLFLPTDLPADTYDVDVTINGANIITIPDGFTLTGPRFTTPFPPTIRTTGAEVEVFGDLNSPSFEIDGTPATHRVEPDSDVFVTAPPHVAGRADIEMITPLGSALLEDALVYIEDIQSSGITPTGGAPTGGTSFTINGANFVTGARVTFDGHVVTDALVSGSSLVST